MPVIRFVSCFNMYLFNMEDMKAILLHDAGFYSPHITRPPSNIKYTG